MRLVYCCYGYCLTFAEKDQQHQPLRPLSKQQLVYCCYVYCLTFAETDQQHKPLPPTPPSTPLKQQLFYCCYGYCLTFAEKDQQHQPLHPPPPTHPQTAVGLLLLCLLSNFCRDRPATSALAPPPPTPPSTPLKQQLFYCCYGYCLTFAETDQQHQPLPPPKAAAQKLKSDTLKAVQQWQEKYGDAYKKLALGYHFLQTCKHVSDLFEPFHSQLHILAWMHDNPV